MSLVDVVALCVAAGCSPGRDEAPDAAEPGGAGSSSPGTSDGARPDTCQAATPQRPKPLPPALRGARDFPHWYGREGLWLSLRWVTEPESSSMHDDDGTYRVKYATVTTHDGLLTSRYGPPTVRAQRTDGPGSIRAAIGGYAHAAQTTLSQETRRPARPRAVGGSPRTAPDRARSSSR
ncbi:hypothetical protein GCM10027521_38180 [Amycolatopsis cihanbeyliensis]